MDVTKVFQVLAYVIPGFIGLQWYRAVYPVKKVSDTVIVLWSLIHTLIILAAFGFLSWLLELPQLNYFTRPPETLGWKSAALLILSGFLYGSLLAGLHWARQKLSLWTPDPLSIWAKVNLQKEGYWTLVRLKERDLLYFGWISDYTFDPDSDDQDFLLRDARCVDENLQVKYLVAGLGVYLNTRDVISIEFIHAE
ncbi:MAG: hypothetical protein HY318_05120 [Armatimonadetes bacterium]|nr:hypothetical protein [Armatimonadota bacterium]